jgi:hypothetical protein
MVRTYKRTTNRYVDEENIKHALTAVKTKNFTIRKAAKKYNVTKTTLHLRLKNMEDSEVTREKYAGIRVFSKDEERALADYCLQSSAIHYGLTKINARRLAYEYAVFCKKKYPTRWDANKTAGVDWLHGFMKRHNDLSIRKPENTSLGRATSFNKENVTKFYENLEEVYKKKQFKPSSIFNIDESPATTVLSPPRVIAKKGKNQVGQIASGERGENVTFVGIVSAAGNSIPPVFIFPRVNFKTHFMDGAPADSLGLATKSGWMTTVLFVEVLKHLQLFTKCSKEDEILLLMDNHESHISIETIQFCRDNGITILTFPPHCTHRMQPLDVAVFGPFKAKLKVAFNDFLLASGGKLMITFLSAIGS